MYAYLLNNYWHTNYKADQAGPVTFRFQVRPHGRFDPVALRRFSAATEQPLLAAPAAASAPLPRLPFALDSTVVVASAVKPADDGRSTVVRLYNPSASPAAARLVGRSGPLRITREDGGAVDGGSVRLPAFGTLVLRVEK